MDIQVSSSKERARDINMGVTRINKWYNGPKRAKRSERVRGHGTEPGGLSVFKG